jgi:uncharacterized protein with HEPN domain
MSSEARGWPLRLKDMIAAVQETRAFITGMSFEAFRDDPRTLKAVLWNLSVVGEAARHAPAGVVAAHPEIPWAPMRDMRNRIVHGYDTVDAGIVWQVVQAELPPVLVALERLTQEHR